MRTLYLECNSGISGDMIVAALLDLGADREKLEKVLAGIKDRGVSVKISRVMKNGVDCCDFDVVLDEMYDNHDHDMGYLYGHLEGDEHHHDHEHYHEHEHHHDHHDHDHHDHDHHDHDHHDHDHHDHHHDHDHHDHDHHDHDHHDHDHHDHDHEHHHHHEHRNLRDVTEIINSLDMSDNARSLAIRVFEILAAAEAKAHAKSIDEVHFHEVGAIDSIVDIVSAAVCFDDLGITDVIIPKISEGSGSIRCQHGILPVPVPAVLNIAADKGLPIAVTERKGELITPTGAAFAAAVMTSSELPEVIIPEKIGLGAGKRAYKQPSILRAVLLKEAEKEQDCIWKLETNIDDSTGELLGYTMNRLMDAGARDVFYTPVYMKKNRPGWLLSVLTDEDKIGLMEDIIFRETTTIGIRRQKMERTVLARKKDRIMTRYGEIEVKICDRSGEQSIYPEYESAAAAAAEKGIALREIYAEAERVIRTGEK